MPALRAPLGVTTFAILGGVLLCSGILGLALGSTGTNFSGVFDADPVVWQLRAPIVAMAACVGAALAVAGLVFQTLLRNPLADPFVSGVSGGAALGGIAALGLGVGSSQLGGFSLPLFTFAGGLLSTLGIYSLAAARRRTDPLTLLLAGVVFNAFAAAIVTLFKAVLSPTKTQEILFWLMGSISIERPQVLAALAIYILGAIALIWRLSGVLNLLLTGDTSARALGVALGRYRFILFAAASLLVGTAVAFTGMIAFVGLVVPHVARRLWGSDHRILVVCVAILGAAFLILADALARSTLVAFGQELPVGVVTACVGGPFFLWVLFARR